MSVNKVVCPVPTSCNVFSVSACAPFLMFIFQEWLPKINFLVFSFREQESVPRLAVSHLSHDLLTTPTPAPVPDFRSGIDTVLETGPGAWELRAKGQERDSRKHKMTSTQKAIPTTTHMALVRLQKVRQRGGGRGSY